MFTDSKIYKVSVFISIIYYKKQIIINNFSKKRQFLKTSYISVSSRTSKKNIFVVGMKHEKY